ncbi:uncharacterized protein LOC107365147 isoform X2 [Tetranychus urticae]|uniref:uncharacterized protein LOC107365147 isoform X2 n=1 Tax=Tetranychus urticae TaxID=32264 RepID=UPI00077B9DD0|nr:uncharacterized protein LOC107365147 isoform X2 [Tetranychus urticae]
MMASSHTVEKNDQFLDGENVIDFAPTITSTQLVKPNTPAKNTSSHRRKRLSRVLQEPICNEITSYWRTTKRNRVESINSDKGIMLDEEDGDSDFYNNDARLDIVWADDNPNRCRKNVINLKPIEKVADKKEVEKTSNKSENMETSDGNQVEKVELVLNNLISCLRVDPTTDIKSQCDIKSQEVKQNTSFGLSSSQPVANISDSRHCDGESKNDLSHAGCQEILASSLDEDIFDNFDDCDWLSQIPDEALLLDEKAFVEKGDNGVISKALLLPRENVPVPKREDVIPKSNSQSTTNAIKTSHDSAMLDQENKNIPSVKERKTIPPQLIRRSILSYINDNKQGEPKKSAERPPLVNKPNALGEVTNTLGKTLVKPTNFDNKQIPGRTGEITAPNKFVQAPVAALKQSVHKSTEKPPCDIINSNHKEDDEFEFDDDDDELFKSMDLDLPMETQPNQVSLQPKEESNHIQEAETKMDQDSFVWDEDEADDICRKIDISIFN